MAREVTGSRSQRKRVEQRVVPCACAWTRHACGDGTGEPRWLGAARCPVPRCVTARVPPSARPCSAGGSYARGATCMGLQSPSPRGAGCPHGHGTTPGRRRRSVGGSPHLCSFMQGSRRLSEMTLLRFARRRTLTPCTHDRRAAARLRGRGRAGAPGSQTRARPPAVAVVRRCRSCGWRRCSRPRG